MRQSQARKVSLLNKQGVQGLNIRSVKPQYWQTVLGLDATTYPYRAETVHQLIRARWPDWRQLDRSNVRDIASVSRELRPFVTGLAASSRHSLEILLVQYTAWALFLNEYDQYRQVQRPAPAGMVSNMPEFQYDPALFIDPSDAAHSQTASSDTVLTVSAGTTAQKSKEFEGLVDAATTSQKRTLEEVPHELTQADSRPRKLAKTRVQSDVQQALEHEEAGHREVVSQMTARNEEHKGLMIQLNHLITRMDEVHNDFNNLAHEAGVRRVNIEQLRTTIGDHVETQVNENKRPTE